VVKQHFGLVTLAIVALSLAPLLWVLWRERGAGEGGRG
jgi:hypothetical protein